MDVCNMAGMPTAGDVPTPTVHHMASTLRFPSIRSRDLTGTTRELPGDFEGEMVVALIAFRQRQQSDVDSWLSLLTELADTHGDLRHYELPVIGRQWAPVRRFIDGGMARSIGDPEVLARTLTVYGDVGQVCTPLGITDRDSITVVLTDRAGVVHWLGSGRHSPANDASLRHAIDKLVARRRRPPH